MRTKRRGQTQCKDALCRVAARSTLPVLLMSGKSLEKVFLFPQDLLHLYGPDSLYEDLMNTSSPLPTVVSLDMNQNKSSVDAISLISSSNMIINYSIGSDLMNINTLLHLKNKVNLTVKLMESAWRAFNRRKQNLRPEYALEQLIMHQMTL